MPYSGASLVGAGQRRLINISINKNKILDKVDKTDFAKFIHFPFQ
jgi:hypothetical protein